MRGRSHRIRYATAIGICSLLAAGLVWYLALSRPMFHVRAAGAGVIPRWYAPPVELVASESTECHIDLHLAIVVFVTIEDPRAAGWTGHAQYGRFSTEFRDGLQGTVHISREDRGTAFLLAEGTISQSVKITHADAKQLRDIVTRVPPDGQAQSVADALWSGPTVATFMKHCLSPAD